MLESLRRGAGTWVAKIFIGLLVLSFAVWGIADIFSGFSDRSLATVGETEIAPQTFRNELQRQISNLSNQIGRQITSEESRRMNLPQRVLGQLITDAALDNQAAKLGLGVSDEAVANNILRDPSFKDQFGKFNKLQFERILQANGLSEAGYAWRHRGVMVRQQIASSIMGEITPPKSMLKALDLYRNEARIAEYFVLPAAAAGKIDPPSEAEAKEFHKARASLFTAPQYRALAIIELTPKLISDSIEISDEDIAASYEARKKEFQKDETRNIDQMMFTSAEKAAEASKKLKGGAKFEDVLKEYGFKEKDVNLGNLGRNMILDKSIADAAFSLAEGAVSEPVKGTFGTAIIRVRSISPASIKTLAEVKERIKSDLALVQAEEKVLDIHDMVEDERAAGSTLKEIAAKLKLKYITIAAVDANGRGPNGKAVEKLPSPAQKLLKTAFESDIGVENDPISTPEHGYIWVDVTGVTPEKLRPIDTVREQLNKTWEIEKRSEKIQARALELLKLLRGGEPMQKVAESVGAKLAKTGPLKRGDSDKLFSSNLIRALFAGSKGDYFDGRPVSGEDRIIGRIDEIIPPDSKKSAGEIAALAKELGPVLRNDILAEYVGALRERYGVRVNSTTFQALTGGGAS